MKRGCIELVGVFACVLACSSKHGDGGANSAGAAGATSATGGSGAGGDTSGGGTAGTVGGAAGLSGMGGTGTGAPSLCPRNGQMLAPTDMLPGGAKLLAGVSSSTLFLYLTANDTYVIWGDNHSLHRATIADGSDAPFYSDSSNSIQGVSIDGGDLYFTEAGLSGRGVAKLPLEGSATPVSLVEDKSATFAVVSDGFVYYATGHGTLARVPIAGGTPTDLASVDPNAGLRGLAVAGGYVWFRLGNGDDSTIMKLALDAASSGGAGGMAGAGGSGGMLGTPVAVATTSYLGAPPASDGTNLYYGDNQRLMKIAIAGGDAVELAVTPTSSDLIPVRPEVISILALPSGVVWAQQYCADLHHTTPDGTELEPLLHDAGANLLAMNATSIFVAIGGQIIQVPKP